MAIGEMSSPSPSPGLRVLVVDDERDTVITLAALLEDDGHQVAALYRAHDVIAKVKDFDPDVVILDIALPDGSGYAIAEDLRRRGGPKRPLPIALTGIYKRPPTTSSHASSAATTSSPRSRPSRA